jgi:23S rRNA (guanosine2251-2'-O)-methyltransferase
MIVYGKNVYSTLKNDPDSIEKIYVLQGLKDVKLLKSIQKMNLPYEYCSRSKLDKLAQSSHHNGIACSVTEIQTYSVDELVKRAKKPGLLVCLDGIQDPHNVGAILRTCDCTGVDGVIMTKHNSAGLTPAAVKASTGAAYTVPVSIVTNLSQTLRKLKENGYWVIGTDMNNAREYREGMYDTNTVLVIGSEGKGISPLVKKQCDYMVYLPMVGSITSLNASVACAVLLYEVYNQRNPKKVR